MLTDLRVLLGKRNAIRGGVASASAKPRPVHLSMKREERRVNGEERPDRTVGIG